MEQLKNGSLVLVIVAHISKHEDSLLQMFCPQRENYPFSFVTYFKQQMAVYLSSRQENTPIKEWNNFTRVFKASWHQFSRPAGVCTGLGEGWKLLTLAQFEEPLLKRAQGQIRPDWHIVTDKFHFLLLFPSWWGAGYFVSKRREWYHLCFKDWVGNLGGLWRQNPYT